MTSSEVDEQFRALADPTRRAILIRVWSQKVAAGEIANHFAISRPAVSRHLRVLRESVQVHVSGTTRYYRADRNALGSLRVHFEAFWETGLPRRLPFISSTLS